MGMGYGTDNCLFTGLPADNIDSDRDALEYYVTIGSKRHLIRIISQALEWNKSNEFFKENKYVFEGLLLNNKWFEDETQFITEDSLKELLSRRSFPKTPKDKLENLFINLSRLPKEDGSQISLNKDKVSLIYKLLYFKSQNEFDFYLDTLRQQRLLSIIYQNDIISLSLTFEGLNKYIQLKEEGENSNKCFIAMSFKNETKEIRLAIREAVEKTGFTPILIDEQDIDSEKTINDEIIANLKKSKFCISDFTFNSNGVYFEAGFALGQGKKVIYTIQQEHLKDAHFDTKSFQHIVYDTPENLKIALINKIEAWIK